MRTPTTALQVLDVQHNLLSGPLPSSWSQTAVLARALELRLSSNRLTGSLPDAWAGASAFPLLQVSPANMLSWRSSALHPVWRKQEKQLLHLFQPARLITLLITWASCPYHPHTTEGTWT